ncbi:MAG: site-specific integrase [Halobacteriovoraceae bacterium]|nr:site-specific integrase [Halobacteriovoraceae bacterium]
MEIIKNKSGFITGYREKVYVNGKAVSKTFKSKTLAKKWKREQLTSRDKSEALGLRQDQEITFKAFAKLWLENYKNNLNAIRTFEAYFSVYNTYLKKFENKKLVQIVASDGFALLDSLCKTKLSISRKNYILRVFKTMLNSAVKYEYLVSNPLKKVDFLKEIQNQQEYWNAEEVCCFLNANKESEFYELFVIALNTGLRRGEILGLCWDCVDLKRNVLIIRRTFDRYGLKETTKTGRIREVPLNDAAKDAILKLVQQQRNTRFVFTKDNGDLINIQHISDRLFKKAIKKAGVKQIRFHSLRATMASNFVMAGGDLQSLSKILGHSTVEMTVSRYAHLHPDFLQKTCNVINFTADVNKSSPNLAHKVRGLHGNVSDLRML